MPINVGKYMSVEERALELGCNIPNELCILPRNFDTAKSKNELLYESSSPLILEFYFEMQELLRPGLKNKEIGIAINKISNWIGPTIFISAPILTQNPHIISITEGIYPII